MSRPATRPEPNELMMKDIIDLLRRQKVLIVIVMLVCILVAVLQALTSVPMYRASVQVLVEGRTPNSPQADVYDPLNQMTTQAPVAIDIMTQMELMQSQQVMSRAYRLAGVDAPIFDQETNKGGVTVDPVGQTNVLIVNVESPFPETCSKVAENITPAFNDFVESTRLAKVDVVKATLAKKLDDEISKLQRAETSLDDYKERNKVLDVEIERNMKAEGKNRSDIEKVVAERDLSAAYARLNAALAARRSLPETQMSSTKRSNTEAIEAQRKIVNDLVAQREQLLTRYQPGSQAMQKIDAELKKQKDYLNTMPKELVINQRIRNPLIDSYDTQVEEARQALKAAQAAASRMTGWAASTSQGMATYSRVMRGQIDRQRAVEEAQTEVNIARKNLSDLEISGQSIRKAATVLSSPSRPFQVKPNWAKNLALAILIGFALAIAMAVVRDRAADRVVSVAETDQLVGALPLGYIPALPRKVMQSLGPPEPVDLDVKALPGQTMTVPEVALESYRILRANMAYSTAGAPVRSVLITSTSPREGKTVVASNLAVALAADGKRVILVDCNLRRPALHQVFRAKEGPGLGDVLLGRGTLGDVLQPTSVPGLSLISAGMETLSASELFGSPAMEEFHKELIDNCDIAILDGAQCARVADAQVLSSIAEGVLYVVQLGVPKKASMRFGIGLLKRANARILGVVFNRLSVNEDNAPQV